MVKVSFNIGDYVYLKTDIDQYRRLVTGYTVRFNEVTYLLSLGEDESTHYELEISNEIDILLKSSS
jgi:hypothetical protein